MTTSKRIATAAMGLLFLAGCVSTTTGSTPPEADDADAAELNYTLGARYYNNGSYELARDRLLLSIELNPDRAIAHSTLALTYEALGNERLAAESYKAALKAEPRNFDVQNTYAVFLCRKREFKDAKKYFERAANHPENDDAEVTLTNAGVCMTEQPDLAAAEGFFREALERRTEYPDALLQLCLLKYRQQEYLVSRAFLQRFMSVSETTAGVLYLAAQIEEKLGNDRGRTDYVNQLLKDFPESDQAKRVLESG